MKFFSHIFLFIFFILSVTSANATEFQPLAFSGSVYRDGIFSAFGLLKNEFVTDYLSLKIKPPKALSDKTINTDEFNYGIGLPVDGLYIRGYKNHSEIIGSTKSWTVEADELTLGYRIKTTENGHAALSVEYSDRDITSDPIYTKATGVPVVTFLTKGSIKSFKITNSINSGENLMFHYMAGISKAEYSNIKKDSYFGGFGFDRRIKTRVDWQNSAIYINSDDRPKNVYLSSRINYRLFKGLNISIEGSMYTNGYTTAPFRFADHFVPGMGIPSSSWPSSYKTLENKAFGFYGIGFHYGVKF